MSASAVQTGPVQSQSAAAEQAVSAPASAQQAATLGAEVLKRYPHDPAAFTQGLQWVEGRLLESTGQVGESGVRWVWPATGEAEQQAATPNPQAFGEGATFLNGQVYHITWQTGEAYRFSQDLELEETYTYQGEGWGLTHDGQELIMSDGSATLFFRDPHTFKVTRELTVMDGGQPVTQLNELEWADGFIWANVWMQNRIARIDPQSGHVTGWLDASALADEAAQTAAQNGKPLTPDDVLNGIAYNSATGSYFLTGKRWPVLFEVRLSE
ncbi:MAG: glutaminyl-peptide cyclotransferase [Deinococcus sp.]|nr:glutaminyl-peptide cyclotransferase [Deinococcus sp.]